MKASGALSTKSADAGSNYGIGSGRFLVQKTYSIEKVFSTREFRQLGEADTLKKTGIKECFYACENNAFSVTVREAIGRSKPS
ncbi:hypothetical protein [Mesorhizobium sp. M0030]|uniref:hypothetical protein n=1 Tax=Mesorhizobium sp. M0030 TaxID=2956851 RepID=UPI0033394D74